MSNNIIKAIAREAVGSASTKKLRNQKLVPAVVYGAEYGSKNIALDEGEITKFVNAHGSGAKLTLEIEGQEEMAIIKNLQRDVVKRNILHIEMQHLSAGQAIKIALPVTFEGEDKFTKNLVLSKVAHELNIEALPKNLIDYIAIDVSGMSVGDVLTVGDLKAEDYPGLEFTDDPETTLATLMEAQLHLEESAEGEEEAAEEGVAVAAAEETEE